MNKTKILRLFLSLLLLMTVGVGDTWALWRNDIGFTPISRASQSGNDITSTLTGSNQNALAIADLSALPGITTVGLLNITFDVNLSPGSRWQIGIGDKDVRGTNANGSSGNSYNTDGLFLHFGDNKINNYVGYYLTINGNRSQNNDAYSNNVHVDLLINRNTHKFSYRLSNANDNSIIYFQEADVSTSVDNMTIIEAYTWANGQTITLSNITINYNFFFNKTDETIYIEDLVYNNPLDNGQNKTNVAFSISDNSYLRQGNPSYGDVVSNFYPIKTTGSEATNVTEGDYITVTATADETESTRFRVRIKTRNLLDPNTTMKDATTNTFDVGSTVGMLTNQVVNMTGLNLYLGYQSHTPVVRSINGAYGLTIIDNNGWTFGNYAQDGNNFHEWGTVYKIEALQASNLTISGYFANASSNPLQLYTSDNQAITGKTLQNPGDGSLATATFSLDIGWYLLYVPGSVFALKSLSYSDAYFENSYAVTTIGSTYTQTITNMSSPVYSIVDKKGDIASTGVTINSTTGEVSNITAGGALKIQATGGGKTAVYYLTVAYPATPYPGKLWDFNTYNESQASLKIHVDYVSNGKGFPRIDARNTPAITFEGRTEEDATGWRVTDNLGGFWRARNKNVNAGSGRDARWRYENPIHGDNAFVIEETAGLVFNTGADGFFIRNDRLASDAPAETPDAYKGKSCWSHVGIRQNGSSFTIPRLNAGDIIEINWKRESGGAGGIYKATNVTDLRGKPVNEQFEMTGSQNGTTGGVLDIYKNPGYTSFIATGGDATFTLYDTGATDILSIRIYSGDYRSTMRTISGTDHRSPQTTMLLDNDYQEYEYDYCNVLNSTNTGPAIYVLKGYRRGVDDVECVSGTNAGLSPTDFVDNEADYPAYPVLAEESARLYDLRKNLIDFRMYNHTWQSSRNSYNNGRVGASSGWGKVTIRMNNYTNDMKYVIGYTNDVTMTFGSAPHQTYPYTWDFTKIAGGTVTGANDNVLNSIGAEGTFAAFSGQAPTNWIKNGDGQYMLNTDNSGEIGSQYVPGAVLVSTERALSKYRVASNQNAVYAKDELDGLGFSGDITMHVDHLPNFSGWNRKTPPAKWNSILSFNINDFVTFVPREGTEVEDHDGTWVYSLDVQPAGSGRIKLNNPSDQNHIDESTIPAGGIGFRLDNGNTKYIRIIPESRLQKGDIISVTAYNAYNNRDAGINFNKSASKEDIAQYKELSGRLVEETLDYEIVTNDGLDGREDFYLYMRDNTVHITAIEISRKASSAPDLDWSIYTLSKTTITVPDLNAGGKQDWIYVSATKKPTVTNADEVTSQTDGPDANPTPDVNTAIEVYKFKVREAGNSLVTFDAGTKIYKIGVTHILKEIHPVGGVGWATESRNHHIDHSLIGYFTKNDVNAYTVRYDSYDMKTATVALTPVNEDGYVPEKTGIVMKLDNTENLSDANSGKYVPLFYPSYTLGASSTAVNFPDNNWMYQKEEDIDRNNRNYREVFDINSINYTKFILTNKYWTFNKDHAPNTDESAESHTADAAGFYRMHIWKTTGDADEGTKNTMPANSAFLLVPSDNLPVAVWTLQPGYSAARGDLLGVYNIIGPGSETAIGDVRLTPEFMVNDYNTDGEETWYTVSGMKLSTRPTKPGLYIYNNRKVVIK